MSSDDDLIPPNQYRTQNRSNSTMSQTVTSSSAKQTARAVPGTSRQSQLTQDARMSQLQEGMEFLLDSFQKITGTQLEHRAIKRPAEQKPFDKKPDIKEQCTICKKFYANKTTLFRHYRGIHKEMNAEQRHGWSLNNTVVSLDGSLRELECSICGYIAVNQTTLDRHNRTIHSNVNVNKENENNNVVDVKDKMHKCEECACYFEERSKFDEHMKVQHGFEIVCKICNKNFHFKDIDKHVKDSHPEVYNEKDKDTEKGKKEEVIVEKVMRNRKGERVHVFTCTKCDNKFYDNNQARKHARSHKKGLKIKVVQSKVSKPDENIPDMASNDDFIFTCEACDVSTGSYDAVVEHSQNHITNMNIELVTQTCPICDLKFEPLCYKVHIALHYKNKEIHRESFKYFKYKFQLLLKNNWMEQFSTDEGMTKNLISKSVYANTRSVKMLRVSHEGVNTLYKCCKCDHFVDPDAVRNHTLNYDTCLKVKTSFACDICKRKFNNRLTRDKHTKDHNGGGSFKIVLFNNDVDKEFNAILNDPEITVTDNSVNADNRGNIDDAKVIYKCLCGLCFARKETADLHTKICPGKDSKLTCPKCNNLFNPEELLAHCFEHHLNESPIIIENFTPDIIVIDFDEEPDENNTANGPEDGNVTVNEQEIIEIDSSDEDDQENKGVNTINIAMVKSEDANYSKDETDKQEEHGTTTAAASGANIERNSTQMDTSATDTETTKEDEEFDNPGEISGDVYSDDSHDTIADDNVMSDAANSALPIRSDIKCVPTNLLLNPFHFENNFLNGVEIIRRQIEAVDSRTDLFNGIDIKKEKPWMFDPIDYSKIRKRPSLRQIEASTSSISQEVILESLLTDDEENEGDMAECDSNNISAESPVNKQNGNSDLFNEFENHKDTHTDDIQLNSSEKYVNKNKTIVEIEDNSQRQLIENAMAKELGDAHNNTDGHEMNIDPSLPITNMDNFEDSDDDLFLPSGKENNNTSQSSDPENDTSKNMPITVIEVIRDKELMSKGTPNTANAVKESEKPLENNLTKENEIGDIQNDEGSETENNMSAIDNVERQRADNEAPASHSNDNEVMDDEENNPRTANIIINNNIEPELAVNENSKNSSSSDLIRAVKREIGEHMNIKIKTELIAQHSQDGDVDCNSLVEVKTEPRDRLELRYNNTDEDFVIFDNVGNVENSTCCIC